jgi:hypothetical protein
VRTGHHVVYFETTPCGNACERLGSLGTMAVRKRMATENRMQFTDKPTESQAEPSATIDVDASKIPIACDAADIT